MQRTFTRVGVVATRRIKIALITPFFPNSAQPFRGNSTYQLARELGKLADVTVFCALPSILNGCNLVTLIIGP